MTGAGSAEPAAVVIKYIVAVAAVFLAAYLVWGLRSLIVPASVGGLLAYICRPLVARLERYRMPRGLAVGLLLLMFAFVALASFNSLRAVMPSETGVLDLRVRALYALNHRYRALMRLDPSWTRGNQLYQLAHRDLDPLVDRVSELLALTPDERDQFVASREWATDAASARSNRLLDYDRANTQTLEMRARRTGRGEPAADSVRRTVAEPRADVGSEERSCRGRRHPLDVDDRAADLPVPVVGYGGHQARPAQSSAESALRAHARRAGRCRRGGGQLRARNVPRVLRARP